MTSRAARQPVEGAPNVRRLSYDPLSDEVRSDPYPFYASLRAYEPVHRNDAFGTWIVARSADVVGMLRDPRWSSNYLHGASPAETPARLRPGAILLFLDAPEHTPLRHAVAKGFSVDLIGRMADYARSVVRELLDCLAGRDRFDLVSEFAAPLPLRVIARLLGIPDDGLSLIAENAHALAVLVDWTPDAVALASAEKHANALSPYLLELVERKRRDPGNDLISVLARQAKERKLRYLDIVSTAILILAAGQMTSTHMLGNGVLALLRNPDVASRWRSGAHSTAQLVEELLRFDGPVQVTPRTALADLELGGRAVRRGEIALALLGSANRDPDCFTDPDTLLPGRRSGLSATFGGGAHFCIGAPLARVIGAAALEGLWTRFPRLELLPQRLAWCPTVTQRGLKALEVGIGAHVAPDRVATWK